MIQIIKIIAFSGILLYLIFILFLLSAWINKKEFNASSQQLNKFSSIIIAVRNEEKNLPELLRSIENQIYPVQNFEIIFIDDHSTDHSPDLLQQFATQHKNTSVLSLPSNEEGKKSAIRYGVEHAKGDLILTIDADCRMKPEWLGTIVSFQQTTKAGFIIAPVAYLFNNSLFEKILALEFASLIASGASMASISRPILCNGANMAFLKSFYPTDKKIMEMNSPSGDDIFFLLYVKKTMRDRIYFLKSFQSIVFTNPPSGFNDFVNQRKRWYNKSIHYTDPEIIGCGVLVSFANFCFLISFLIAIVNPALWPFFLLIFALKLLTDIGFLFPYLSFIGNRQLIRLAPILEFIYPIYIFYTIIAASIGKYRWKDREYRRK
jgi:cellulose synthase/poly-beta-1,6-N-acetylglucosamine synthase-like glycosyltransferase